jgi:pilus assembly protein CpaB
MVVGEFEQVAVPVPAQLVPVGTRLKDVRFRKVQFPQHQLPKGAVLDITPYLEAMAIAPLAANLPIWSENLSLTSSATNPVIERIPEGMRAMTVRVDATSAVEGWAGSGAVVDVALVESDRTTVVAERVKILSAERSVIPVDASAPSVPSTVTLLVSQEQFLAISTALGRGKITFALRSSRDEGAWDQHTFSAPSLRKQGSSATASVSGVMIDDNGNKLVLTDGRWVKSTVVPEGFLRGANE